MKPANRMSEQKRFTPYVVIVANGPGEEAEHGFRDVNQAERFANENDGALYTQRRTAGGGRVLDLVYGDDA